MDALIPFCKAPPEALDVHLAADVAKQVTKSTTDEG